MITLEKRGLVEDIVSLPHAIDQLTIQKQSHQILNNRAKPHKAKRLKVHRHPRHNHHNADASPTGLRWREGHFVTLHIPRIGQQNVKMQVIGFEMREGESSMDVLGDQFPQHLDVIPAIKRMQQSIVDQSLRRSDISARSLDGTGLIRDARLVLPSNPWKVYAFASTSHAATDMAFNILQLDSTKYDTMAGWDTSAWQYTAPIGGYYDMECRAGCSMPAVNGAYQYWFVSIFVNGTEVTRGHGQSVLQPNPGSFSVDLSSYVGSKLFLNAGDTVQFKGFPSSNGVPTIDGSAGGGQTYAMIHLLSS